MYYVDFLSKFISFKRGDGMKKAVRKEMEAIKNTLNENLRKSAANTKSISNRIYKYYITKSYKKSIDNYNDSLFKF